MELLTWEEWRKLRDSNAPIINICGVELYGLELERMWEQGLRYLIRYRDIIEINFCPNLRGNFYGKVIRKLESPYTKRGRYYKFTAKEVNKVLGYQLLNE